MPALQEIPSVLGMTVRSDGRRGDWEARRLGDGVIGREIVVESFLQFSIHFIFVNLWSYKNKTLEVTMVFVGLLGDGVGLRFYKLNESK